MKSNAVDKDGERQDTVVSNEQKLNFRLARKLHSNEPLGWAGNTSTSTFPALWNKLYHTLMPTSWSASYINEPYLWSLEQRLVGGEKVVDCIHSTRIAAGSNDDIEPLTLPLLSSSVLSLIGFKTTVKGRTASGGRMCIAMDRGVSCIDHCPDSDDTSTNAGKEGVGAILRPFAYVEGLLQFPTVKLPILLPKVPFNLLYVMKTTRSTVVNVSCALAGLNRISMNALRRTAVHDQRRIVPEPAKRTHAAAIGWTRPQELSAWLMSKIQTSRTLTTQTPEKIHTPSHACDKGVLTLRTQVCGSRYNIMPLHYFMHMLV